MKKWPNTTLGVMILVPAFCATGSEPVLAADHPDICDTTRGTETLTPASVYSTPVALGSKGHLAVRLVSANNFNTKCPVTAIDANYDPHCATPEGAKALPPVLNIYDRYYIGPKNSAVHFFAWRDGKPDFLDIPLVVNDTWLQGSDKGYDYFIYLKPNYDAAGNLLKNYQFEVFYPGNKSCTSERPDSDRTGIRQDTRSTNSGSSGEGNTTGGPEPHKP